jgi:hypothetical protein
VFLINLRRRRRGGSGRPARPETRDETAQGRFDVRGAVLAAVALA